MPSMERIDDRVGRFEELSLQHMDGLYNLALHLTSRSEDAEDLVQETYLKGFEHFDKFRPGTNFRAWIFTILRNTFIHQYHKNRAKRHVDLETVERTVGSSPCEEALNASIDVNGGAFRKALRGLSRDARTMLVLAYIEGFTYKEIGGIMDCPLGTVMSRLSRARRYLHDRLGQPRHAPRPSSPRRVAEAA